MSIAGLSLLVGVLAAVLAASTLLRLQVGSLTSLLIQISISTVPVLFPIQLLALLCVWIVWAAAQGAMHSGPGAAGLLLSLLAAAGLLLYLRRQFLARPALDAALAQDPIDLSPGTPPVAPPNLWQALRPLHFKRRTVERIRDLSYGPAGVRNLLDIYRSSDAAARATPLPVLLQLHGSGWMVTNKNLHALPLMARFAAHGWIVVSINYRLSPVSKFPAHLIDVKKAIAWIRENIADYGGDPDFIAVTGGSAGGHLAALAALTPGRRDLQPGFETVDTRVNAAVPIYARYDFLDRDHANELHKAFVRLATRYIMPGSPKQAPEVWELASPVSQVNADAPPFFVIHGANDSVVPVEVARAFVQRLRGVSRAPVAYAELPGLQHAYDMVHSPATEFTCHGVHRFLEAQHRRYLEARRPLAGARLEPSS